MKVHPLLVQGRHLDIKPILSADQVGPDREKFCTQRKAEASSNGENPQTFLNRQDMADVYIPFNRPYGRPAALPLSLLHPFFGEYIDGAENYVPTNNACGNSTRLALCMAIFAIRTSW